ncbi:FIG00845751: hypothetical protein, partial [hydrothermal vent metagenome]
AIADAAATIIANRVNLPACPAIERLPANQLSPDSDLGSRLVTTGVGGLTPVEIETALKEGECQARQLCQTGLINAAFICLKGRVKIVDWPIDHLPVYAPNSFAHQPQDRIVHA